MNKFKAWLTSLFNLNLKTFIAVSVFVALFVAALALNKCHAANAVNLDPTQAPTVQFGLGSTTIRGPAEVMDLQFTNPAPQLKGAYWQYGLTLIGKSTYQGIDQPNNMVLRTLFVDGFGHVDFGLGVSWMLNPEAYNGSNVNFNLQAGYRFTKWPVKISWNHLSNAGETAHNLGRDMIIIDWIF